MIRVVGPRTSRESYDPTTAINTTSTAKGWSRGLSPMILGPVDLYGGYRALNVENAWQYSKVYPWMLDAAGNPLRAYWNWAKAGWASKRAERYPAGKGAVPAYSLWDGEHLGYVEARKRIYMPLYAEAALQSEAYARLRDLYHEHGAVTLWDFDGYDYGRLGMSLEQVLNDPTRKMGHAFVLAMMLESGL